jgi:CBS domain-containing protein
MQIREVMSRFVEVVSRDAGVKEAAMKMRDLNVDLLPVCDGSRLIGIVTIRDVALRLAAEGHDAMTTRVGEIMTRDPIYCFEDQDVAVAASIMQSSQIDRLPVLDRNKQLIGIVACRDITAHSGEWTNTEAVQAIDVPPSGYSEEAMSRRNQ